MMSEIEETKSSTSSSSASSKSASSKSDLAENADKSNENNDSKALSNSAFVVICVLAIIVSFSMFGALIYAFQGGDSPNDHGKK